MIRAIIAYVTSTNYFHLFFFKDAVSKVETDLAEQKVTVTSTLSPEELLEALNKTGKPVSYIGQKM